MNSLTRRALLGKTVGLGALSSLLAKEGLDGLPHHTPTARRVIYLFQSGGPSQFETFDHKPRLVEYQGQDLPDSVRRGQRLTSMSATQSKFPVVPSKYSFAKHGQSGSEVSELLPHTARIVDDITIIKSLHTEAINHDPAVTFLQTGAQIAGRPSMGAWVSYGLGAETGELPAFVDDDLTRERRGRPTSLRPALGQRIPAYALPGRQIPFRGGSSAVSEGPRGLFT